MGALATLCWDGEGEKLKGKKAPWFSASDSKAYAEWIAAMQREQKARTVLADLGLRVLIEAWRTEGLSDDAVKWAAPAELEKAARAAHELLMRMDTRFDPVLQVYWLNGAGRSSAAAGASGAEIEEAVSVAARSAREWRDEIRRVAKGNPWLLVGGLQATEQDQAPRADFLVVRASSKFEVQEDAARFPTLSVMELDMDSDSVRAMWKEAQKSAVSAEQFGDELDNAHFEAETLDELLRDHREHVRDIAKCIVNAQKPFLKQGPASLEAMSLAELTKALGWRHEILVRETIKNKYLQTPHGLFPFEYFVPPESQPAKKAAPKPTRKQLAVARGDMAQDLTDVVAMAAWAARHRLKRIALELRW
jgi:hypothetical protein